MQQQLSIYKNEKFLNLSLDLERVEYPTDLLNSGVIKSPYTVNELWDFLIETRRRAV